MYFYFILAHSRMNNSPSSQGGVDIEQEVGDHEVDSIFRDPGHNPLIVARQDSPIKHPLLGNTIYPMTQSGDPCLFGTLSRKRDSQNFGASNSCRPVSERYHYNGEMETQFQQPKRVQFPQEEYSDHNHQILGNNLW